ncbi:hypothetical protein Bca4012_053768 [Brassica carinata]
MDLEKKIFEVRENRMWTSNNQIVNQKEGRLKRYITAKSISLARFVQGLRDTVLSLARFEEPRGVS